MGDYAVQGGHGHVGKLGNGGHQGGAKFLDRRDILHDHRGEFALDGEGDLADLLLHVAPGVCHLLDFALVGLGQGGVDTAHILLQDFCEDSGPLLCVAHLQGLLLRFGERDTHTG